MIYKDIRIKIPEEVNLIIKRLHKCGYEAYIVGGCVRDSLLKRRPDDWDITTNALPDEMINLFESSGYRIIPTGLKHGTVTLVIENADFELTTYRIDGKYSDKRHPDKVKFTNSLKEDLSRRDFTINAMAYNDQEGLIDYFGGINDLKNKTIKCVGNPVKRFSEDALRMMRAYRFAAELDFKIEKNTEDATFLLNDNIKNVSMERIQNEFSKMLLSDNLFQISSLNKCGILKYFIPEYDICEKAEQNNPYHIYSAGRHLISSAQNINKDLPLRLAMLLHDIAKPKCKTTDESGIDHFYFHSYASCQMAEMILKRMKYDNDTIKKVTALIKYHDSEIKKSSQIRKLLSKIGEKDFRDLLKVKEADIKAQSPQLYESRHIELLNAENELNIILNEKQCFKLKDLKINGRDLIDIGFSKGEKIGMVLNKLLNLVIENPELNDREYLLNFARTLQ